MRGEGGRGVRGGRGREEILHSARPARQRVPASLVAEQLLNQVDVRQQHAAAAVALEAQLIESIALIVVGLEELQVRLVLVACAMQSRGQAVTAGAHTSRGEVAAGARRK